MQNYNSLIYLTILVILYSIFFFANHLKISQLINLYDKPNNRKKHLLPVPITGGLGLMILIIFSFIFFEIQNFFFISKEKYFEIIIFSFSIFFIGIIDDKYELNHK